MLVLEFKVRAKEQQYKAIDEAIRTAQFIQNKCLRYWMDNKGVGRYDLNKYCRVLAHDFKFANELNSQARQSSAERAWSAIARFYDNCKRSPQTHATCSTWGNPKTAVAPLNKGGIKGGMGFPKFKKNCRSVEYKQTGWQLDLKTRKAITFTDKKGIGRLRLVGSYDLHFYQPEQMKRVRLVRRADGYYCQFLISIDVQIKTEPTNKTIGLDVGLSAFYTDDQGKKVDHPKFLRTGEKKIKRLQRQVSRKQKGSNNRKKARQQLAKSHLKISRQRKEFCKRVAYSVIHSNDVVAYEDLRIKNLIKNHTHPHPLLGGEPEGWVNDAAWYQFRVWLEYFGRKYGKVTIAVPPQYTSQNCSNCGKTVKKSLSTRTHVCSCGCQLDRDENAAKNILRRGLSTAGHTGTFGLEPINALGELTSTLTGAILLGQVDSLNKESPVTSLCD